MKPVTLTLIAALASANIAFAQSGTVKNTDQAPAMNMHKCSDMMDKNGMGMKGMDMKGMDMKGMNSEKCKEMMQAGGEQGASGSAAVKHKTVAVVKKVDKDHGKVTLSHEAVDSLKWPAMTMVFSVKDKNLYDKLTAGKKVNVEFVKQGPE
jgi:Cu(I)/Ag(I) efflux system protein CusF